MCVASNYDYIMNIGDIIKQAKEIAESLEAGDLADALARVTDALTKRDLKVVVLGEFKAGKSTLINRIFLQHDVLPIEFMETTAVPTHIRNGSTRMRMWQRDATTLRETCVATKDVFERSDVAAVVTAPTDEARSELAEKYSKVTIDMPCILPDGITVVDTPGLNTPNSKVYVNTLYEARTAHALLYVVRGKQLGSAELKLLADLAGIQQPSLPLHVVLTTDGTQSRTALETIRTTITAQLAKVGVLDVEVSSFYVGKGENSELDDGVVRSNLENFLGGEVQRGRHARIIRDLRPLLERLQTAVVSRLELDGRSKDEIKELKKLLAKKKDEYLQFVRMLLNDVVLAQRDFLRHISGWLEKVKEGFREDMDKRNDLAQILEGVKLWQDLLPDRVQRLIKLAHRDFQTDIHKIERNCSVKLEHLFKSKDIEMHLSPGVLIELIEKTPYWALYALDMSLVCILLPTNFALDIVLRLLGDRIPLIAKLMPLGLLGCAARSYTIHAFNKVIDDMQKQVAGNMSVQFREMSDKLQTDLQNNPLFPDMEKAIEKAEVVKLPQVLKEKLQAASDSVRSWLSSL